jgi:putative hemolysin
VSLTESSLKDLKKRQRAPLSNAIAFWENHSEETIAAMIIGMNLSLIGLGITASSISADLDYAEFPFSKTALFQKLRPYLYIVLPAFSIIAALLFGNIFPKTFAKYNSYKIAPKVFPIIIRFSKICGGFSKLLSKTGMKIVRLASKDKENFSIQAGEIDFLLSNKITSPLPQHSREIVSKIMDFPDRKVSQVMISRSKIFAVNLNDDKENIINSIIDSKYSRIPAYRENLNNIAGIIYARDLAFAWKNSDIIALEDLIRPAYFVPENAKVNDILKEFKKGRYHIAVVVDEFASTVGIVSIEDLIEEIVGEVLDEYDKSENFASDLGGGRYLIQTNEAVLNFNEKFNSDIKEEGFTTINGWVLSLFGRIPKEGEKIKYKNFEIEVLKADSKKTDRILLKCIIK